MEERRYRSSLPVFLTGTIDNKRKEKEETITAGTQAQHPKNGSHSYSTLCAQKRKSHKYFQPNPSGRRKKSNQINARLLCASGSSGSFRYSIAVPEFDFSLLLIYFLSFLCVWPTNSRSTFSAFVSSIFLTRDSSISTKKSRFGLDLANTSHHLISVAFFFRNGLRNGARLLADTFAVFRSNHFLTHTHTHTQRAVINGPFPTPSIPI